MTTADERPPSVADFAYNDFYGAMVEREHLQVSRDEATWSVQDVVVPEVGTEFKSNGLARFLIERIDELGQDVPWRQGVPIRAAIHGHLGEHPVRDAHPSLVMQLLERVPGVDLVGMQTRQRSRLAHKYFVPSYAVNAPDCPCNGECTRTGAVWLDPHPVNRTAAKSTESPV
jgi:hypothetical protein